MSNKTIAVKKALEAGWRAVQRHLFFFLGVLFIYLLINIVPTIAEALLADQGPLAGVAVFSVVIAFTILQIILGMGLLKIAITIADEQAPSFNQLFSEYPKFWRYLGVNIMVSLITFVGFLLLIIPGIIWAIKYQFATYLVIDKNQKVFEALRNSGQMTRGVKWQLFLFSLLVFLINVLGILALGVGLLVTALITMVAYAYVYRHLASTETSTDAPPDPAAAPPAPPAPPLNPAAPTPAN